jgi:hypothetical protein
MSQSRYQLSGTGFTDLLPRVKIYDRGIQPCPLSVKDSAFVAPFSKKKCACPILLSPYTAKPRKGVLKRPMRSRRHECHVLMREVWKIDAASHYEGWPHNASRIVWKVVKVKVFRAHTRLHYLFDVRTVLIRVPMTVQFSTLCQTLLLCFTQSEALKKQIPWEKELFIKRTIKIGNNSTAGCRKG